jgi:phosphate transport system substrate-binding protein
LFVYPSGAALERSEVQAFLAFYLDNADAIADQALFVPLTEEQKTASKEKVESLQSQG